jgi:beta-glucosidase
MHHSLSCQKLFLSTIDERVTNMLTFIQKMARKNPEIVYGDGSEGTRDSPEARLFCRKVAANGMVLLKNEGNLLPLTAQKIKKLAVIGPNTKARIISGGGSAALKASYVITPWEGIVQNAPSGIDIKYEVGCYGEHGREHPTMLVLKGVKQHTSTFQHSRRTLSPPVVNPVGYSYLSFV